MVVGRDRRLVGRVVFDRERRLIATAFGAVDEKALAVRKLQDDAEIACIPWRPDQ